METQYTDCVFFFLSGLTFRYKTNIFSPNAFENRFSKEDLATVLDSIYSKTNYFQSLQEKLSISKRWSIANVMLIVLMLFLLIISFQRFNAILVAVFGLFSLVVGLFYLYLTCKECSLIKDIDKYENVIEEILHKKNQELLEKNKGMKLTVMKEFVIIVLHADYLRDKFEARLVSGSKNLHPYYNTRNHASLTYGSPAQATRLHGRTGSNANHPRHSQTHDINAIASPPQNGNDSPQAVNDLSHQDVTLQVDNQPSLLPHPSQIPLKPQVEIKFKGRLKYTQIDEVDFA